MIKKIIHLLFVPIGGALGYWLWKLIEMILTKTGTTPWGWVAVAGEIAFISVLAIAGYFLGGPASEFFHKGIAKVTKRAKSMSAKELFLAVFGLLIGFIVAFLVCQVFRNIDNTVLVTSINAVVYICCGVLGVRLALMHRDEVPVLEKNSEQAGTVLDASILVDGRAADIVKTGFLRKPLYIPKFVLDELSLLADSEDAKKRTRGRLGLDTVKVLQEQHGAEVVSKDYSDSDSIDDKLIAFARKTGCSIMTNDYSLNMVASIENVTVLNANELVNALKPTVVAGDEIKIEITKAGKEPTQGVGYLDDGTMVVIENGAGHIDKTVDVCVTGMLQTNAGKIIFAKIK